MTPCRECNLGRRDILSDRLNYSTQQKARCTPTILSAGPTLALPRLMLFRPLSNSLSRMADDCLTYFDHLISDSLIVRLACHFSCATTPRPNLSTVCSRMIMTLKVSNNSIPKVIAALKAFMICRAMQTSENMWCPRLDYFLYFHFYLASGHPAPAEE